MGTLCVYRRQPGASLTAGQQQELGVLAAEVAPGASPPLRTSGPFSPLRAAGPWARRATECLRGLRWPLPATRTVPRPDQAGAIPGPWEPPRMCVPTSALSQLRKRGAQPPIGCGQDQGYGAPPAGTDRQDLHIAVSCFDRIDALVASAPGLTLEEVDQREGEWRWTEESRRTAAPRWHPYALGTQNERSTIAVGTRGAAGPVRPIAARARRSRS